MGEEGLANAASESEAVVAPAENGSAPHDSNVVTERRTEETNGLKEEEDDKDEEKVKTDKMGIGRDLKEEHDKKEQKEEEEPETEEMEEAPAEEKEEVPEEMKEDEENNKERDKGVIDGVKHGDGEDEEIKEEKLGEEKEEEAEEEKKVEESEEKEQEKTESREEQTETEKAEQSTDKKGLKRRRRQKNAGGKFEGNKKQNDRTPRTPTVDRPVRERKSVERLVASIERDATKDFHIEKGRGTPLKDIPNVAFKLSRRKTDDTFKLLHNILFGRRGKAFQIKGNISRFSGFVWHDNEEKQRNKVKEKLDKCTKEKLLELCDVLDIPVSKTSTRKEDIVMKLIDFLVAPHATTTLLLAEKESGKGQKRKRLVKGTSSASKSSSKRTAKSRRKSEDNSKKERKKPASDTEDDSEEEKGEEREDELELEQEEEEETENGVPEKSDDEMPDQSESEEKDVSEDESEEDTGKKENSRAKSSSKKESVGKAKSRKSLVSNKLSPPPKATKKKSSSKRTKVDNSDSGPTVFSRKKNERVTKKSSTTPAKSASKEKTGKKAAKGKDKSKEGTLKPSDVELRNAICEILKEVDFNTATFTDILKQLAEQFDTDLTPKKQSIKLMIQEELTKLADEADDEDGEGDAEKDEPVADAPEVKA